MTEEDVRALLRKQIMDAGSQRAWAKKHKMSEPYISDVLHGRRAPAQAICDALGLERTVTVDYNKKVAQRRGEKNV